MPTFEQTTLTVGTVGSRRKNIGGYQMFNDNGTPSNLGYYREGNEWVPVYLSTGMVPGRKFHHERITQLWLDVVTHNADPVRTGYEGNQPIDPTWRQGGAIYEQHMRALMFAMSYVEQLYQEAYWALQPENQHNPVVPLMLVVLSEAAMAIKELLLCEQQQTATTPALPGPGEPGYKRPAPPIGEY